MAELIYEVPASLFAPAEADVFTGTYSPEPFEFGPDEYAAVSPFKFSATISNVGGALLVTGTVEGTLRTSCARCIEDFELDVQGELEGYFIIEGEGEAPEDMDEDEFDVLPESKQIDFQPLLYAAVLVDLPYVPLCREDCKGICPQCGANLNEETCDCKPAQEDLPETQVGANNPFAVLKDLNFGE